MNELDLSLERPYSAHGRSLHLPPGYRRFSLRGVQFNWKREKSYHERRDLIPYAAFPFCGIRDPCSGRGSVTPRHPTGPHLCGCRHAIVACAWYSQLVGHRTSTSSPPVLADIRVGVTAGLSKAYFRQRRG